MRKRIKKFLNIERECDAGPVLLNKVKNLFCVINIRLATGDLAEGRWNLS